MDSPDGEETVLRDWLREELDPVLSKAARCTNGMREDQVEYAELDVEYRNDAIINTWVNMSSFDDCDLLSCIKRTLVGFKAAHKWLGWRTSGLSSVDFEIRRGHVEPALHTSTAIPRMIPSTCEEKIPDLAGPPSPVPPGIQPIVRAEDAAVHRCYAAALNGNPDVAGSVSVRLVIDLDGTVASARVVKNTLSDCEAVRCVRDAYHSVRFPVAGGRYIVDTSAEFVQK